MALEDLTGTKYLDSLVSTNPLGTDYLEDADAHIRGLKNVLLLTFPNLAAAMTADATELNQLDGTTITEAAKTLLDDDTTADMLATLGAEPAFASTTRMIFQQTAAPTGWTKDTTAALDDVALRVTTGTVGTSTGNDAFTSVFGSSVNTGGTTLSATQSGQPGASITVRLDSAGSGDIRYDSFEDSGDEYLSLTNSGGDSTQAYTIAAAAAASSHNHSMTMNLDYYDVIVAEKD